MKKLFIFTVCFQLVVFSDLNSVFAGLLKDPKLDYTIRKVAGASRVKLVYARRMPGKSGDVFPVAGFSTDDLLIKYDSETGKEDTVFKDKAQNYQKPLISRDGTRIIYTNLISNSEEGTVYMVDWNNPVYPGKKIARGFGSCLWFDEKNKKEYLIYSYMCTLQGNNAVYKINLDSLAENEIFFNEDESKLINASWFGVSSDSKTIILIEGWPNVKAYNRTTGVLKASNYGCWASTPYDTTGRIICLETTHKGWLLNDGKERVFYINSAKTHCSFKMGSYSDHLAVATWQGDNDPGVVEIFNFNDSLTSMVDSCSVTDTSSGTDIRNNSLVDIWVPTFEPDIVLTSPEGFDTLHVFDTVKVTFKYNKAYFAKAIGAVVEYSIDTGKTWCELRSEDRKDFAAIEKEKPFYANARYVIPDSVTVPGTTQKVSTLSKYAKIRVRDYGSSSLPKAINRVPLVVLPPRGVAVTHPPVKLPQNSLILPAGNSVIRSIYDIRGQKIGDNFLPRDLKSSGVYIVRSSSNRLTTVKKAIVK